jgi:hypothetical protein
MAGWFIMDNPIKIWMITGDTSILGPPHKGFYVGLSY